ncbi:lysine histidine transporter-like 8 [Canna indica]|uniref:Lysine histidine transporter-like 8 n=1 Tax=Canna indica TaxID=4628 RepID=A0AAQ3KJC2_9LILI|nr:lysine histidine transporter-like 8 [Canna indica]
MSQLRRTRSLLQSKGTGNSSSAGSSSSTAVAPKGHFAVYTREGQRFVLPIGYLKSNIFVELLRRSEEEFGLPVGNRPITLPCDAASLEHVVASLKRILSENLTPNPSILQLDCKEVDVSWWPHARPREAWARGRSAAMDDEVNELHSTPPTPPRSPVAAVQLHSPSLNSWSPLPLPQQETEETVVSILTELHSIPPTPPRSPVAAVQLHSPSLNSWSPLPLPQQETEETEVSILTELHSIPPTPPRPTASPPSSKLHSPSLSRSPLLAPSTPRAETAELHSVPPTPRPPASATSRTPRTPRTPRFMRTPLGSPMRKAIVSMRGYLEDLGHLTKLDPREAWLPITESRNGNAYYSAFHTLSSGIGFQALVLPLAFAFLGWTWGILCLSIAFIWQLYTLWLLIQLHESVPGTRYSRYIQLATATFGPKLGNWIALFPILYLSAGTCMALIIVGGGSMKLFFSIVCGPTCESNPLTAIEWYLVFACLAAVLSQLPNLNSIAGISLVGSITAVSYCTLIWTISVSKGKQQGVSYDPVEGKSGVDRLLGVVNALGIIAFAFRGHNLVLEIQATMPSSLKHPSHVPMWRGVKAAYLIIALCLFPIAIGGFWAYGTLIPQNGILTALYAFHSKDTSRVLLGLTTLLVIINSLSCFQIYAMPVFDAIESAYTSKKNKPCPRLLRAVYRSLFAGGGFFVAVALPFLADVAGLLGGLSLPVTFAFPCFMWLLVKKPERYSAMWYINWALGSVGMALSAVLVMGGIWNVVKTGIDLRFFKPQG